MKIQNCLLIAISCLTFHLSVSAQEKSSRQMPDQMRKGEMKLVFSEASLDLKYSLRSPQEFKSVEMKDPDTAIIHFKTPQWSAQPESQVPAKLLQDFKGIPTLDSDIKAAGHSAEDMKMMRSGPEKKKVKDNLIFTWSTPTLGSARYYYLQHPKKKNLAVKIGPLAGPNYFDIDWENSSWIFEKIK